MSLPATRTEKFRQVIEDGATDGFVILVSQIDPDALAVGFALREIIRTIEGEGTDVRISFCGQVGHPQNQALINFCNLWGQLTPIEDLEPANGERIVLVDSSAVDDSRLPETWRPVEPRVVIDHHRSDLGEEGEDDFYWVEDIGAAATLVVELMEALDMEPDSRIALLLALGIYTDTKALVSSTSRDRDAYGKVTESVRPEELNRLIQFPLPASHYENLRVALGNVAESEGRLVAGVGQMRAGEADDLSAIADYLLRRTGVTLAIVWGIVDGRVRVSARSNDLSMPLDQFLKSRFGEATAGAKFTPDGRGEGGALIELELGIWMSGGVVEETEALVKARMRELVLDDGVEAGA